MSLATGVQFAEAYATEAELSNALDSFGSWRDLVGALKLQQDAEDNEPTEPAAIPDGRRRKGVPHGAHPYRDTNPATR